MVTVELGVSLDWLFSVSGTSYHRNIRLKLLRLRLKSARIMHPVHNNCTTRSIANGKFTVESGLVFVLL